MTTHNILQMEKMEKMTFTFGLPAEIYTIFRVHNLGKKDEGVRIYVDSEGMKLRQELTFTANEYIIAPAKKGTAPNARGGGC
jgi:hypothetical protein